MRCPTCGQPAQPDGSFCGRCGHSFTVTGAMTGHGRGGSEPGELRPFGDVVASMDVSRSLRLPACAPHQFPIYAHARPGNT